MRYKTIVADPPWDVMAGPRWASSQKSQPLEYPTMSLEEIGALDVQSLAEDGSHLYLWTINKYLEDAFGIVRSWGFKPSTTLVWCKPSHGLGLGGAYVLTHEYLIFARRGVLASKTRVDRSWFEHKRLKHSQKPEMFQDMVEQISPGPYLELFARRKRLGWDVWGNEVDSDVELSLAEGLTL